jgi:hypothetical protein
VAVGASGGPFTIDVELAYQPIAFRWARNLDRYDAPEPERFLSYYAAMAGRSAEVVARALTVVPQ